MYPHVLVFIQWWCVYGLVLCQGMAGAGAGWLLRGKVDDSDDMLVVAKMLAVAVVATMVVVI